MSNEEKLKAVIIAGGRGERLKPLTDRIPKPMIPVGNKPILEHQINLLKKFGIKDIIFCLSYKHEVIEKYFGDGSKFEVKISYSIEGKPLGTGGALKKIEKLIDSTFLVIYGDIFFDINLRKLITFHNKSKPIATIVLHESEHPYDSDLIVIDDKSRIINFLGKPDKNKPLTTKLSKTSIYIFEPQIFVYLQKKKHSFEDDVLPNLIKTEKVYGYVTNEYIKDIGTLERLNKVISEYKNINASS